MKNKLLLVMAILLSHALGAQPWEQDNSVFNPSGVPSLTFSQPRFADLDGDGDQDFLLGNINRSPIFIENTGTANSPAFTPGADITAGISGLAAEMGVCADMDGDGDLDLVTGGYTGLHLFENVGSPANPVFAEVPGYFSSLTLGPNPVPDLADVDSDGDMDLVVGLSEDGGVKLYENTGTPSEGQFSGSSMQNIGDIGLYAYPVFCDLDGDGDMDILCGRDLHGFVYFENAGDPSSGDWQENSASFAGLGMDSYWNSGDLADLDGDGLYDLVYGTASGPLKYYLNTGTQAEPAWQENTSLFGGVLDAGGASSPVFYDFDDDGDLDMISGSQMGDIKYYENTGNQFSPAWNEDSGYFSSIDHSIYSAVAIGDVDGDGLPDAIVGDLNGGFYFHRNTGLGFMEETGVLPDISLGGWSVPRLVDLDFDGDLDLVTGNEAGNLRYYENEGSPADPDWVELTGYFGTIDVGSNCVPTLADLDDDGDHDVAAGNLFGNVQCWLNGPFGWAQNTTLFNGISTDQNAAPALVDLDHDGDYDLALGDYDGTFSYWRNLMYSADILNPPQNLTLDIADEITLTWAEPEPGSTSPFEHYNVYLDGVLDGVTTGLAWVFTDLEPEVSYTAAITAQYIAGESLPIEIEIFFTPSGEILQSPLTLSNNPNPFDPSTTISFNVEPESTASLTIFSQKGQVIRSWEGLAPGNHSLVWDGKDDQGQEVSSGVYFYRLRTRDRTLQRKMLLVK